MVSRRVLSFALFVALATLAVSGQRARRVGWLTHGGNAQHDGIAPARSNDLRRVAWSTPLDLNPQYNGDILYAHYGSPVVTADNVVVVPVKTGATSGFRIEARNGRTGALLWQEATDYVAPPHGWFPTLGPTLVDNAVAYARKAGWVQFRDLGALSTGPKTICFYGMANYQQSPAAYDDAVRISSPLVTDSEGSVFFTYRVTGDNPLGLQGGVAVVRRNGTSAYIEGSQASGGDYVRPKLNAAPAVFKGVVYAVLKKASGSEGGLVGLRVDDLQPLYKTPLLDPRNGGPANVDDDGTSCPTVGGDGDVYFGVLENPFGSHHYRGWLLHFDRTLATTKTPGSFGWDDTPSLVPSQSVPGYTGTSKYLVLTKYNNYAGAGDGVNKIALLDPNATQTDAFSNATVMKEIYSQVGPTADWERTANFPNAVREWCVNTAAVDAQGKCVLVNNEDGVLYRWNLVTNELDQSIRLNSGVGQAYTPTVIGPNGTVYAVSNAQLYAVSK